MNNINEWTGKTLPTFLKITEDWEKMESPVWKCLPWYPNDQQVMGQAELSLIKRVRDVFTGKFATKSVQQL